MSWWKKFAKKKKPPQRAHVVVSGPGTNSVTPLMQCGVDWGAFTPRAQKALELARQEADRLNHNFVGTEHLLLGLVALGQGTAVNVLTHFGIGLAVLRNEVEKFLGVGPKQSKPGCSPFTPRVKKVLALADREKKALNHAYISTGHVLLALLREGDGVAARVLKKLELNIEKARSEVLKELAANADQNISTPATPAFPPSNKSVWNDLFLTPRSKQALAYAREEADRLPHKSVGAEHLLIGLIRLGSGGVAQGILQKHGVNLETVRSEIEKESSTSSAVEKTEPAEISGLEEVISRASKETRVLNYTYVGTESVLLALLSEPEGIVARIFKNLGVDKEKMREEILKNLPPGVPGPSAEQEPSGHFFSPDAQQALAFATSEAARRYHHMVGTEHLLLGLIMLGHGRAARTLHDAGLNLETVGAEVNKRSDLEPEAKKGDDLLYTADLKKALSEARKEADRFASSSIRTEHLLLGLLNEQRRGAATIFKNAGVDMEEMRLSVLKELARATFGENASFTPRAQKVLALARQEADRFNHNFVGTEHLLLGLMGLNQGVAVGVMMRAGISLEAIRVEVGKQFGTGPAQKMIGNIPYTPRVKKVLALAAEEAKALYHSFIGTEHILLGLLREGGGVAARILKNHGLELEKTREEILKELNPHGQPPSPDGGSGSAQP